MINNSTGDVEPVEDKVGDDGCSDDLHTGQPVRLGNLQSDQIYINVKKNFYIEKQSLINI